jgi:hypothetical protein
MSFVSSSSFSVAVGAIVIFVAGAAFALRQPLSADRADLSAPPPSESAVATSSTIAPAVAFDLTSVSVDYATEQSNVTLTLHHVAGPVPKFVWVWVYFINPGLSGHHGNQGRWSGEPVKIDAPFREGSPATVTVQARCSWCDDPELPKIGYYAKVRVSTVSKEDASFHAPSRDYSKVGALWVPSGVASGWTGPTSPDFSRSKPSARGRAFEEEARAATARYRPYWETHSSPAPLPSPAPSPSSPAPFDARAPAPPVASAAVATPSDPGGMVSYRNRERRKQQAMRLGALGIVVNWQDYTYEQLVSMEREVTAAKNRKR